MHRRLDISPNFPTTTPAQNTGEVSQNTQPIPTATPTLVPVDVSKKALETCGADASTTGPTKSSEEPKGVVVPRKRRRRNVDAARRDGHGLARGRLASNDRAMARVEGEASRVLGLLFAPGFGQLRHEQQTQIRERASELRQAYANLNDTRWRLAEESGLNPIVAFSRPTELTPGTRLYSSATPGAIGGILRDGIRTDIGGGNFGEPEMGRGLYVDTEGGSYRRDDTAILVLEVVEPMQGVLTPPIEELVRGRGQARAETLREGYAQLQEANPFLRHAGLPPADTEIVLRRSDRQIRVVGVVEHPGPEVGEPQAHEITPIAEYLARNNIALSESWKTRRVLERTPEWIKMDVDGEGVSIFKALRPGQTEVARLAEAGASALANDLLGQPGLVPVAKLDRFEGHDGTRQPFVQHRPVIQISREGVIERDFDPRALTRDQVHTMFAHMLVDYVISNHDDHARQFGIDQQGRLIAFDKAQAFKFFNGPQVQSALALQGVGPEAAVGGPVSLAAIEKDEMFSAYAKLRAAIREGDIRIDLNHPIIADTLVRCATLDRGALERHLGGYAHRAFPGREAAFIDDVLQRAHGLLDEVRNLV